MLEQVIKRDGSIEEFKPSKLNKWSQWASSNLSDRVNWSKVVLDTIKGLNGIISSQELQNHLIKACLNQKTWPYNIMAGRLYIASIRKQLYGDVIPTLHKLQTALANDGYMRNLNYSYEEYQEIESYIQHDRDFGYAHFQIQHIHRKYSIQDRTNKVRFETPQFTFMRMAMALAEDEVENRLLQVKEWYNNFSLGKINAPTPNYVNLGTSHAGYASCCVYTAGDSAASLAIGDHIAYTMTYMSAGIGANINTRSICDPIRGGILQHQGKLPYYRALAGAIKANLQAGRGGACTVYYSCYDPEALSIAMLQNPLTPKDKQNRNLHFAVLTNRFFAQKVASNEEVFQFNVHTAPDLTAAFYSGDYDLFVNLYQKYAIDPNFTRTFFNARKLLIAFGQQAYEVGTHYYAIIDEMNRHTPFKEPIYSSNLCNEISEPTAPYVDMRDLYSDSDHGRGEVALCNLAAININAIEDDTDYANAMYYALKMIDKTIHLADYTLPHVGFTAKQRLNAGVGIIGLAYDLAKHGYDYTSDESRQYIHEVAERHMYMAISQSLRLGKELGNAPWIHKTKWVDGWMPIDTYKKAVDQLAKPIYKYDWEQLRKDVVSNQGIRNSCLIAYMPTESSSKASSVPNSIYPIRSLYLKKTDLTNVSDWCAPDGDLLQNNYAIAWQIPSIELIKTYSVIQKFTDQAISADLYKDRSVNNNITTDDIIQEYLTMVKYGLKGRYYQNTYTVSTCHDAPVCECEGVCSL